jgi:asparagine synthase (glutamine-hydrolysing)
MSRFFAVAQKEPDRDRALVDLMARSDDPSIQATLERHQDVRGHWSVRRREVGRHDVTGISTDPFLHVFVDGGFQNAPELTGWLGAAGRGEGDDAASLVSALYRAKGLGWLPAARGSFSGVVVDERTRRISVFSDRQGSRPLYWHHGAGRLILGSSVRSLLANPRFPRRLDPRAVADYLTFGFLMGDKTLNDGARLVPPGSVLTYDWQDDRLSVERYGSMAGAFTRRFNERAEYLSAVTCSFAHAVERACRGAGDICLSLSGGLDSRAILSAMNGSAARTTTYTVGVRDCADETIARELAGLTRTRHQFLELSERALEDFLPPFREMVALSDGMYLSHGLTESLVRAYVRRAGFSTMVRGHGGELAKMRLAWPLQTDDTIGALGDRTSFVDGLLARMNHVTRVPLSQIFESTWCDSIEGQARHSLEQSLADLDLSPRDRCSHLYLMEHHRRFTLASLAPLERLVSVRLPFVDPEFLAVLFGGAPEWRDATDIHQAIMQALAPELLAVRNSNTGAPGNAGALRVALTEKINTALRRLNAPGFRHYHSLERWMRQTLLGTVESVLLDGNALARGVFRPAGVRRLIDDTRTGAADHAHLLEVLLILELWQQEMA